MDITIKEPTKAIVKNIDKDDLDAIVKKLSYTNTSIAFQITKHYKNWRLKKKDPVAWQDHLDKLNSKVRDCLLKNDGKDLWIRPGSIPYLHKWVKSVKNEVTYPDLKPLRWKVKPDFDPFPYQNDSVRLLIEKRHGNISLPTGSGKSLALLLLAQQMGLNTVVITPSQSIFTELLTEFQLRLGKDVVGGYGDGYKDVGQKITIAIGKSLTMLEEGTSEYEFFKNKKAILIDECFRYDTRIHTNEGPMRIGSIVNKFLSNQKIPMVLSFNEREKSFEYKKITNAWRKPLTDLVEIKSGLLKFQCTKNHKILTKEGWKKAFEIKKDDQIVSKCNNKKSNFNGKIPNNFMEDMIVGSFLGDGHVSYSKNGLARLRINHGIKQSEYAMWKLNKMGELSGAFWIVEKNGYSQKPAIQTCSKSFYLENYLPSNKKTCPDWIVDRLNVRSLAIWFMDDGSLQISKKNIINGAKIHTESFDEKSVVRLINKLKNMGIDGLLSWEKRRPIIRFRSKEARKLIDLIAPHCHSSMNYKLNKNSLTETNKWDCGVLNFGYSKVTSVGDYSYNPKKEYKKHLFDIEVEDNHNFIVGSSGAGFVAHNCHTFAAEQLNDVCNGVLSDVPYRMFVSATPTRNDGTEKLLASIIGENVFDMSLHEAISQGYLCPLNFTVIATTSPNKRVIKDPTICKRQHFLYNPNIAAIAAKIANGAWDFKQQSTLILVEELEQIKMLQKLLTVPFAYVHSADKKKAATFNLEKVNLQESVKKFNTGEVKVLIGTKAIATGTNLYPVHNLINWVGGSSEIVTKQGSMGRATRRLEISKFKHLHTPKPFCMVYDFRVKGESLLDKQLVKRCGFYQEAHGEITYF